MEDNSNGLNYPFLRHVTQFKLKSICYLLESHIHTEYVGIVEYDLTRVSSRPKW